VAQVGVITPASNAPPVYASRLQTAAGINSYQVAAQNTVNQNGIAISVGRATLAQVEFEVDMIAFEKLLTANTWCSAEVGIGLYRSVLDRASCTWSRWDPCNALDRQRDDWLAHRIATFSFADILTLQAVDEFSAGAWRMPKLSIHYNRPFTFGQGECLGIGISILPTLAAVGTVFDLAVRFRTKYSRVW
jgi:hypothetical protein